MKEKELYRRLKIMPSNPSICMVSMKLPFGHSLLIQISRKEDRVHCWVIPRVLRTQNSAFGKQ